MWILSALLSLLTTNLIFTKALGTSTLMAATKSRSNLAVLAGVITGFSMLACILTSLLFRFMGISVICTYPYVLPLVYTLVISVIYIIVLLVLHALFRKRFGSYKKYIHLSAFSCAVMGTLYLAFEPMRFLTDLQLPTDHYILGSIYASTTTPVGAALFGLQSGLGFLLPALMLSAVRKRLYDEEVPAAFRGFPAVMVYLGLLSMAIYAIGMKS